MHKHIHIVPHFPGFPGDVTMPRKKVSESSMAASPRVFLDESRNSSRRIGRMNVCFSV